MCVCVCVCFLRLPRAVVVFRSDSFPLFSDGMSEAGVHSDGPARGSPLTGQEVVKGAWAKFISTLQLPSKGIERWNGEQCCRCVCVCACVCFHHLSSDWFLIQADVSPYVFNSHPFHCIAFWLSHENAKSCFSIRFSDILTRAA